MKRSLALERRKFLGFGFASFGTFLGASLLKGSPAFAASNLDHLGPLQPADANGVRLPKGFTSRIVARSRQRPHAGSSTVWHDAPDGGATFPTSDGGWIYVSNSEIGSGGGGVGALRFDAQANIVGASRLLDGTSRNCAGGKTPWRTWLSCEESGDRGRVFECFPFGGTPVARLALGRFNHEAVAVDPVNKHLYLTEDRPDGGFYRFRPSRLKPDGWPDLTSGTLEVARLSSGTLSWVKVPDPGAASTPVRQQVSGIARFNGGEGIGYHAGNIYFATKGDNRIWKYAVSTRRLTVLYDDNNHASPILTGVDNIEISADGDILVAEDGGDMQIVAITPTGRIVPVLQVVGHSGSEITGPAFDPSRRRLYFSSQTGKRDSVGDGYTFEVTGPFAT